ncbi:hypothetical protein [Nocardia gamkensis]|uniref:Uncharacterized protein n=1 Tax=Nocardia gamkensis TaxID=352869 RepID=A0A7X6LBH2_9NOCA|nr:hypothetical protein [Nocardia gamkensis]NKY31260.1 hypothetical protein [Nocardia gamkensis]NQE72085.1 hypothetical protein [Nocardia gamkensis]
MPLLFTSRPFDLSAPSNLNLLAGLLRDKIIPWMRYGPTANVESLSVTGVSAAQPTTDEQVDQVLHILRTIGAVR